ncbi:cytochrome P450 [Paraphoma chrysanthemicola]|nr:cytochrome P450 [Paraphoma chrysanthemicola]
MANFSLLLLAVLLAFFVSRSVLKHFLYHYRVSSNGCARPPKYAHKVPFFGLDLFAKYMNVFKDERFLDFNKQMFHRHGKTFESNVFGARTFRTIESEVSRACFATYAPRFGLQPLRYEVAKHLWGNGIIVVDGEHWKHGRALMRSSFEVVHLANAARFETHVKILDTSSEFIFGEAVGALGDPAYSERLTEAFAYAQKGTAIRAMLKRLKFLHRDEKWWEACRMIIDYADKHVEKAHTQDKLTLRSHIINVFSPAHDGAAITLTNAMFHLARQPDIWARLREEIIPTKHESLTYDLLNSYRYISHRQCLETTILPFGGGLGGKEPLYVEKGDNLECNYRAMTRDESFWGGEADRFVPERWEHIRPGWEHTPFGGGPRSCPGQRLVFMESAYVLVNLLRKFSQVQNRDAVLEWREEMRMTLQSKNGCLVGLIA